MIPVVAFTSSREMPVLLEFYKHGVNACPVKPMERMKSSSPIQRLKDDPNDAAHE